MRRVTILGVAFTLLSVGLAIDASPQEVRFYDTMSGANFVQWWQTNAVPACQRELGTTVKYTSTGSPEVLQRIKSWEPGKGDVEVLFLAPDKIAGFLKEGVLEDLRQHASLIPNSAKTEEPDNKIAAGTELNGTGIPFFRYSYVLVYNSEQVKTPPQSWKDLYERRNEWKGRISYVDPRSTVSGAGRFFVASFLKAFGSDWKLTDGKETPSWKTGWERLAEFEKANFTKHATSGGAHISQFATGEIWIGFHALDFVEYSKKLGTIPKHIRTAMLQEGVPGGAGYLAMPKGIPDARKVVAAKFINCALSDKIQVDMVENMLEFPGTAVWDKISAETYKIMPDRKTMLSTRLPDPPADAIKYITDVWAQKVGY